MLSLQFNVLAANYPRRSFVPTADLFREIGWDDLIKDPKYENTCATRVSLALIKSGIIIPDARMSIRRGPFKNHRIEPGQVKLSHILARNTMLGAPEKYKNDQRQALGKIGERRGIVSFFHLIPGLYEGGHIDIVSPDFQRMNQGTENRCGTACHWTAAEVWFWPLH
ncbi:T6SS effector amidase Tae4 family protein [Massilia horti]|uniref:Type VI secretion system amidase effector protein Tae4 n=1 Tax=Massilia horti TaxID=2562153 RepID=A0A4Y9T4Z4_9BURK|nr:T6SS effector amidase Tae4 family protein [Massilia horti]TFW34838.1 hypothetical protein E4O92_03105 [Massilia horti]